MGLDGTLIVPYFLAFLGDPEKSALLPILNSLEGVLAGEWDNEEWFLSICFLTEASTCRNLHRNSDGIDREF